MPKADELILLIDKASAVAGSDYKLAASLGVGRQTVSNWRHGQKPCPVEDQALLASIAGLDPAEFLVRAVVLKHQGTAKGDRLMKVLGKSSIAIGGVLSSVGASAHQIFSMVPTATTWTTAAEWAIGIYTMCIMLNGIGSVACLPVVR